MLLLIGTSFWVHLQTQGSEVIPSPTDILATAG